MSKKVFIGLSGGVDSAVAAQLLIDQGYTVTGVFLKNWSGENYGVSNDCPWKADLESARAVASHLGIALLVYNFEKEYREHVITNFFSSYENGETPNPDVLCNKYIKFNAFLDRAISEGADYIATGHYAKAADGRLFNSVDYNKDQTYFLHQLTREQLSRTLFPLAELTKPEVREIAKQRKLPNFSRRDSQGICFIGKIDLEEFLGQKLKQKEGEIIDFDTGKVVGKHNGIYFYTIGQRKGLSIGGAGEPYFVSSKNLETNTLYVVKGRKHPTLWKKEFVVNDIHLINPDTNIFEVPLLGMIRYRAKPIEVSKVTMKNSTYTFTFSEDVWTPAKGQSLVLYSSGECLGGGVITEVH